MIKASGCKFHARKPAPFAQHHEFFSFQLSDTMKSEVAASRFQDKHRYTLFAKLFNRHDRDDYQERRPIITLVKEGENYFGKAATNKNNFRSGSDANGQFTAEDGAARWSADRAIISRIK